MKKSITLFTLCLSFIGSLSAQGFGKCVNLDGIDDYAFVPHHESLNPADGSWSVALWIKAADKNQVAPFVMKRLTSDPYTQYSYGFAMDDPHNPVPGKRIRVNYIENSGLSERSGNTTNEFIDGNWHHIVIVADKDENGIVVFVDGVEVDFIHSYFYGSWPSVSNTSDLIIARRSASQLIEGPMDELSIWNRALKEVHVAHIMNNPLAAEYYTTTDSGLVAYYRFDEFEDLGNEGDGADDFRDLSVWQNHADSEGNPELIPSGVPVGIRKASIDGGLYVWPNPTTGEFKVQRAKGRVECQSSELIDLYGNVMKINNNRTIEQLNNSALEIDISNLPSGIYFIRINFENQTIVKKIIKL